MRNPKLLYATSARLGGSGLDAVALESARVAGRAGMLGRVLAFANRQGEIPAARIGALRWHPVRLLSGLGSEFYYGAKKHALDRAAARELAGGRYGLFHGWSGESVRTLRTARQLGVPSVIEIPTWHRHKGKDKPARLTKSERERDGRSRSERLFGPVRKLLAVPVLVCVGIVVPFAVERRGIDDRQARREA